MTAQMSLLEDRGQCPVCGRPLESMNDGYEIPQVCRYEPCGHTIDVRPCPLYGQDTIGSRWWSFHQQHPDVELHLVRLARQHKRAHPGRKIGIGMLWEVLRWETSLGSSTEPFRLDNRHRSRYARWIMDNCSDLADIFEIRALHPTEEDLER